MNIHCKHFFHFFTLSRSFLSILLFVCAFPLAAGQGPELHPFVSGSLQQIVESHNGRPFILVMWSPECSSCRKELDMLTSLCREHPKLDVILVATDEEPDPESISRILREEDLSELESWYFAGPNSRKMRYEIDSSWYGEIPRTYLYGPDHERIAVSGLLKSEQLKDWISSAIPD